MVSGSAAKYPVLSVKDICRLARPIQELVTPDSCLFLWATVPMKPEAFEVLDAWGYTYKTTIFWDKERYGLGHWFRGQVEELLVGVRGKPKPFRCQERNIIRVKSTKHSRKPEESYALIENATPGRNRLELFATRKRENWDCWGNEVESDVEICFPSVSDMWRSVLP